jgi:hypothetical protein
MRRRKALITHVGGFPRAPRLLRMLATVAAAMAFVPAMVQESAAAPRVRSHAPREHYGAAPRRSVPFSGYGCSDPGAHLGCPAAPVHDNSPPPS